MSNAEAEFNKCQPSLSFILESLLFLFALLPFICGEKLIALMF